MMKLFKVGLICLVLTLFIASCSSEEFGEISIMVPEIGTVVREPYDAVSNVSAQFVLRSTFETDKNVKFYVTSPVGVQGPWYCLVPSGSTTQCPGLPLTMPGMYTVTTRVDLISGGVSESSMVFNWQPFTRIDKAISILGMKNATWGYFVMYVALTIISAALTFIFSKDQAKAVLAAGILTLLTIPVSYFIPSAGIAVWMSCYLVPLGGVLIVTAISMFRNPRPNLIIMRSDGTGVAYGSTSYVPSRKQKVVHEREINASLDIQESSDEN